MTKCPLCGKKPMMANKRKLLRGNYNPVNRYKKSPNLQWAKIVDKTMPSGLRRIRICTSCLKAQNKT